MSPIFWLVGLIDKYQVNTTYRVLFSFSHVTSSKADLFSFLCQNHRISHPRKGLVANTLQSRPGDTCSYPTGENCRAEAFLFS